MLTLAVDKAIPGDDVRVRKNAKLRVRAQAWAPEEIGAPKVLGIVSDGRVIRTVESRGPEQDKLAAEFELQAGESQCIVARTTALSTGRGQRTYAAHQGCSREVLGLGANSVTTRSASVRAPLALLQFRDTQFLEMLP